MYKRQAIRAEQKELKAKLGAPKTEKQKTTANYKYVVPDYLGGLYANYGVDSTTVSVVAQLVEIGYKRFGPAADLCTEFQRDGTPGKFDAYVNLTHFTRFFEESVTKGKRIVGFLETSEARHVIYGVTGLDDEKYAEMVKAISELPPWLVFMIVDNAWKLSGASQVAVPAFYFKEVTEFGRTDVYVSPTRYLDHPANIVEAQRKLAAGETKNRSWTVWPEHMVEYDQLKQLEAEKKARLAAEEHANWLQYGEYNWTEEDKERMEQILAQRQAELAALRAV